MILSGDEDKKEMKLESGNKETVTFVGNGDPVTCQAIIDGYVEKVLIFDPKNDKNYLFYLIHYFWPSFFCYPVSIRVYKVKLVLHATLFEKPKLKQNIEIT